MRAVVVTRLGESDVLELQDLPTPEPGPGELVVDTTVIGVNPRDVYERRNPGVMAEPPYVCGMEGAGTIRAMGPGVSGFEVGQRVVWAWAPGSYAEQVIVEAWRAVPIPDGLDDGLACAVMVQGMMAHALACSVYPVSPGESVLVQSASGGIGLLLTQILKMKGARVIATASSSEKAELVKAAGADEVLQHSEVPDRVLELSGGGVPVVYDAIGQATFKSSLDSLAPCGVLATYGRASGEPEPFDFKLVAPKSLFITRTLLFNYTKTREELLWRASEIMGWIADGALDVRIARRYAFEAAAKAQDEMDDRPGLGKYLLTID